MRLGKIDKRRDVSIEELVSKRSTLATSAKLNNPNRKIPKPNIPPTTKTVELSYFRKINRIVNDMLELIRTDVFPEIPSIVANAESMRPDRQDTFVDDIESLMNRLSLKLTGIHPLAESVAIAGSAADETNARNEGYYDRLSEKIVGISVARNEPWLAAEIDAFTSSNARLITSIQSDYLDRVEGIITRGVQSGRLSTEITKEIQSTFKIPKNRAKLIARDQVSKLNGNLNRLRQTNAGVEEYEWLTAEDERVRPTHRANNGKIFKWDSPPSATGHPGEDVNCRCVPIPVIE